jgi:DNA-binding MurR/RpiR family transcriptional regulator
MFRDRIQDAYDSLSPRFKRLATYILENTLDVGFLTATQLASRVAVDPATVVRFAQEIGYTGYRELSREIKKYVNEQIALRNQRGLFEQGSFEAQAAQIIDDISDRTLDLKADIDALAEVAKALTQAKHIYVTGTSEGHGLALVWCTYLNLIGLRAFTFKANAVNSSLLLKDVQKNDIVIGIGLGLDPGVELSQVFAIANAKGIGTIAITTTPSLKPAREADINLVSHSSTPFDYLSFDTVAAQLSVIWQIIMLYKEEKVSEDINQVMDNLDAILQKSYKKTAYNSADLKRLWAK